MSLQLRSEIKSNNTLELSLVDIDLPELADDEVMVRLEAAPLNPSDLGLLFGPADMRKSVVSGSTESPVITADVSPKVMPAMAVRVNKSLPVGNEGAGVVIAAGASTEAQALMGKVVGLFGGAMYAQHRIQKAIDCLVMPKGVTPAQAASSYVNPLTALSMIETLKTEGHKALVHTAAASNLGQMLNKLCMADGIDVVNIVRKPEQVELLRALGAKYIVDSSSETFRNDLLAALVETGATLTFDAVGGGKLANDILSAMEKASNINATEYSRYGSTVHKQVYIYGGLDRSPSSFTRNYGVAWGVNGWLLMSYLEKMDDVKIAELKARVAREITTIFSSHYTKEISLAEVLNLEIMMQYAKQATGEKYLINPNL